MNADSDLKAFLGSGRGNPAEIVMTEWKKGKSKASSIVARSISREQPSPRRSRSRSVRPEPILEVVEEVSILRNQLSGSSSTPATANATTTATTISPPRHSKNIINAGKKRAVVEAEPPLEPSIPAKFEPTKKRSKSVSVSLEVGAEKEQKKGAKGKRAISEVDAGLDESAASVVVKKPRATKAQKVVGSTEEEEWERLSGPKKVSKKGKEKVIPLDAEVEAVPNKKPATKKKVIKSIAPLVEPEPQEESVEIAEPILKKKRGRKPKVVVPIESPPPANAGKRTIDIVKSEDHSPIVRKQKSKSTNAVASSSKVMLEEDQPLEKKAKVVKERIGKKKVVAPVGSSVFRSLSSNIY